MKEQIRKPDTNVRTIPNAGFLRLRQVLELYPVSRSAWYSGIASGRYPAPCKLGPRTAAWKAEDIMALIESIRATEGQ